MAEFENDFEEISAGFTYIATIFLLFSFRMESEVIDAVFLTFAIFIPITRICSLTVSDEGTKYVSNYLKDSQLVIGTILIIFTWHVVYTGVNLSRHASFALYFALSIFIINTLIMLLDDFEIYIISKRKIHSLELIFVLIMAYVSSIYSVLQVLIPAGVLVMLLAGYPIIAVVWGIIQYFQSNS